MAKKKKTKLTDALNALENEMDKRKHSKYKRDTGIEEKKKKDVEDERKDKFNKSMPQFKFIDVEEDEE